MHGLINRFLSQPAKDGMPHSPHVCTLTKLQCVLTCGDHAKADGKKGRVGAHLLDMLCVMHGPEGCTGRPPTSPKSPPPLSQFIPTAWHSSTNTNGRSVVPPATVLRHSPCPPPLASWPWRPHYWITQNCTCWSLYPISLPYRLHRHAFSLTCSCSIDNNIKLITCICEYRYTH